MCMCVEFRDEILLRGEECKTGENSIFINKGKTVISVENLKLFYISDDEMNFTVGIILQNLVTQLNFIGFQDSRNFTFFEAPNVASDTWHLDEWII